MMKNVLLVLSLATLVFSCKNKKQVSQSAQENVPVVFLTHERTPCYGTCEVFVFTIYTDGTCRFEGKHFVERLGMYVSKISQAQMDDILKQANEIGFFSMENTYDNPGISDLPAIITEISHNGKNKRIENRYKGPDDLIFFQKKLDEFIHSLDWKKLD